jgi:hypothetical protein
VSTTVTAIVAAVLLVSALGDDGGTTMMTPAAMTMTVNAVRSAICSFLLSWFSVAGCALAQSVSRWGHRCRRMDNNLDRPDDDKLDIAGLDGKPIRYRPDQGNISQWVVMGLCWDRIVGEGARFGRDEFHIFGLADKAAARR